MKEPNPFRLFGIFGYPLSHTLSPAMQEAAFEAVGLKAFYLALELEPQQFHKALSNKKCALEGFNITVPYKLDVMRHLDDVSPEAKAIGAVNTVFRKQGKWKGVNTDVNGFLRSLREDAKFEPKNKKALVFGAGGAARAVVYGLAKSGAKQIAVINRDSMRAIKMIREFRKIFPSVVFTKEMELKDADLVVNATSLGLKKNDVPVFNTSQIPTGKQKLFFDLIYHVPQTPFMKDAAQKGHRVMGGLGMLLFQGAEAFEYWTGKKAPVKVMRHALIQALQQKEKL